MTNIKELIKNIKKSTLDSDVKDSLIAMLPSLSESQLHDITKTIKIDLEKQKSIFAQAKLKLDIAGGKFKKTIKKAITEWNKKAMKWKLGKLWKTIKGWKSHKTE